MFAFGHIGIGLRLARPWTQAQTTRFVVLGTLLPDLIDKPMYYLPHLLTGKSGVELGVICGTRTFGHTMILLSIIAMVGVWRRSPAVLAVALGMATHLAIDPASDILGHLGDPPSPDTIPGYAAIVWPAMGWQFPPAGFATAQEHMQKSGTPSVVIGEILGLALILQDGWRWWRKRSAGT